MDANLTPDQCQRAVDVASAQPDDAPGLMPARAKMMLGLGAAGLVVAVALLLWSQSANLAPLYPNRMPSAEAARCSTSRAVMGVSPKVLDDGDHGAGRPGGRAAHEARRRGCLSPARPASR